jgi:hypothetical protein
VFKNRVLRRTFEQKNMGGGGETFIMKSFITCTSHKKRIKIIKYDERGEACSKHGKKEEGT